MKNPGDTVSNIEVDSSTNNALFNNILGPQLIQKNAILFLSHGECD